MSAQQPEPQSTDATCYRHPDRVTGRRCTRCGRYACPDCLKEASVGAQCVECVKAAGPSKVQRWNSILPSQRLLATKIIIAINVAAFVLISLRDKNFNGLGPTSQNLALFGPSVHSGEWYRLVTSSVVHYGILHLFFNMIVLYQVGLVLEPGAGPARFSTLYVVSVLGGAAGALIATPHALVGGASGGVVGVACAAALVMHRNGVPFWDTGFGPLLVFVIGFEPLFVSNVSQGGHIGGLIAGLLATEAMLQARKAKQPQLGYAGAAFVGLACVLLSLAIA
jgi:membrane associated rhomboid family serine protease